MQMVKLSKKTKSGTKWPGDSLVVSIPRAGSQCCLMKSTVVETVTSLQRREAKGQVSFFRICLYYL